MKLFIGDTTKEFAQYVNSLSNNAILLTNNTFDLININHTNDYYTSFGDLNNDRIDHCIQLASKVVYHPPPLGKWSHRSLKTHTEEYLTMAEHKHNIEIEGLPNLLNEVEKSIPSLIKRLSSKQQLWFYGCSITAGVGVSSNNYYPAIVAANVMLPYTNLAISGSSNQHQASLILKSDISNDDIVIWGLTNHQRSIIYGYPTSDANNINITHVTINRYNSYPTLDKLFPKSMLVSDHMLYENINAIQGAINFCRKIGAELILGGLLTHPSFSKYLVNFNNFHNLYMDEFIDVGDDDLHPGIKMHAKYADSFTGIIKQNKYAQADSTLV